VRFPKVLVGSHGAFGSGTSLEIADHLPQSCRNEPTDRGLVRPIKPIALRETREIHVGILMVAAVVVAFLGFSGPLLELVRRWTQQEEYSHGFLIPLVAAWLLWSRRDALRASIGQPSWFGLGLILLALVMHLTGELSAIFIFSQIGFVIALYGITLAFGGYSLLRTAFIPTTFLLFAIPLPYFIDAELTLRLQLLSSELGVSLIRIFGIPVYLDGNIIDMGDYKLQVVEACSGLRYLYPLLSLSFLAAYLFKAPLWQRITVFLSAIPIAIGMNGVRIGLVGILVDRWGPRMADGALHLFEGWVIFVVCAALLTGEMYFMSLRSGKPFLEVFYFPRPAANVWEKSFLTSRSWHPLAACLALLCAGAIGAFAVSGRPEVIPERMRFVEFPTRMGSWLGTPSVLDPRTEKALGVDDYILSDYSLPNGDTVNFYVAYYASQRSGESPHSPTVCIPGGGWQVTKLQELTYVKRGETQPLNRVIINKGAERELVYYWFDERGRVIANEYWAKVYLLIDAIEKNRTDGALVRLTTPIKRSESEEDADRRLQSFMNSALPRLTAFLPAGSGPRVSAAIARHTESAVVMK
jgi:exosortase D (VPLPA-CTERM-specific)